MPALKTIPFIDLNFQHRNLKNQFIKAFNEILIDASFISGRHLTNFENNFSDFCRCRYTVGCQSGTAALQLALACLDVKSGDEVITTSHTFVATVEAIVHSGAKPVFVDIDPNTFNIDPNKIEAAITSNTKAIIPVHMYGHPCNMSAIMKIAKKHSLFVIEDCAQAHGALYQSKPVGGFGDIGCFSFYPVKNLGALGDAGAIVTNSKQKANKLISLSNHGRTHHQQHLQVGFNFRLNHMQAAFLNIKLPYLEKWNQLRHSIATQYLNGLKSVQEIDLPHFTNDYKSVFHQFVIKTNKRNGLKRHLLKNGIASNIHYPVPVHLQPAFQFLKHRRGHFPVTESICNDILSLPIYPGLKKPSISRIVKTIKSYFKNR